MTITMNHDHFISITQLQEFLKVTEQGVVSSSGTIAETYEWIFLIIPLKLISLEGFANFLYSNNTKRLPYHAYQTCIPYHP